MFVYSFDKQNICIYSDRESCMYSNVSQFLPHSKYFIDTEISKSNCFKTAIDK